jgi:hypothetical protein
LDNQSNLYKAPNAKNIIYFQYAKSGEVRFSGFLKGCQASLDCLRRDKQHLFGQRLLIFGFNNNGENFGLILNERDDPIISDFPSLPNAQFSSMIQTHSFGPSMTENMNMNMNLVESFYFSH